MIEAPSPATGPAPVLPRGWALRQGLRANPLLLAGGLTVVLIVVAAAGGPAARAVPRRRGHGHPPVPGAAPALGPALVRD